MAEFKTDPVRLYANVMDLMVDRLRQLYRECPEEIICRYHHLFSAVHEPKELKTITHPLFTFNPFDRYLRTPTKKLYLSMGESAIFYKLSSRFGRVVSYSVLLSHMDLKGRGKGQTQKSLQVEVCGLRKTVAMIGLVINNSPGIGYQLLVKDDKMDRDSFSY